MYINCGHKSDAHLNERGECVYSIEGDQFVVVCSECSHLPPSPGYLGHLTYPSTCGQHASIQRGSVSAEL